MHSSKQMDDFNWKFGGKAGSKRLPGVLNKAGEMGDHTGRAPGKIFSSSTSVSCSRNLTVV